MIKVCLADSYPIVHFGVNAYFNDNVTISIVANVENMQMVLDILYAEEIDVLILNLKIEGLSSIFQVKSIIKIFPKTKIIIYGDFSERIYASSAIKSGVSGFIFKNEKLETLGAFIVKANQGEIMISEDVKKEIALIARQTDSERLYRKLCNRDMEVLIYFCNGKKSNEIAKILKLNEKTISTYKERLLIKLNVTNLIDLVNKAKKLEIVR